MTEITQVKLDEMLAGLEGVTPGPWELSVHGDHSQYFGNIIGNYGPNELGVKSIRTITVQLRYGTPEEQRANGDHMARCDPDTMRALIALASQALRSQGEAVAWRKALTVFAKWAIDVSTLGELGDLENRMTAEGFTLMEVGAWAAGHSHPAPQEAGDVKAFVADDILAAINKIPRSVMETANNNVDVFVSLRKVREAVARTLTEGSSQ